MLRLFFVGRRAAGRTRSAALRHLARVHGQMVVSPPADAGSMPTRYTQHHVLDGAYPATPGPHGIERDLVTEFGFDDFDHLRRSTQTAYYRDQLAPDEPRFVDRSSVEKLQLTPIALHEGERGPFKLLLLLTRRGYGDWDAASERTIATLTDAGFGAVQINQTAQSPMGAQFVDVVIEAWHHDRAATLAFADRLPALPIAAASDLDRSLALAVEAFTTDRLQTIGAEPA